MNAVLAPPIPVFEDQAIELADWGLAIGHRTVLEGVSLRLDGPGLALLGGPSRSGKSAMVQTLAGLNRGNPLFRTWGQASMNGRPIDADWHPVLVRPQMAVIRRSLRDALLHPCRVRGLPEPDPVASLIFHGLPEWVEDLDRPLSDLTLRERRTINILSEALTGPPVLFIDSPGQGLDDADASALARWLDGLARHQRVLVACNHPGFTSPNCDAHLRIEGMRVIRQDGPDAVPSIDAASIEDGPAEAQAAPPVPARAAEDAAMVGLAMLRDSRAPAHFHWILPGQLATCVTPGSRSTDQEDALDRLARVGVLMLMGIDSEAFDPDAASVLALETLHQPVSRGRHPSAAQLRMLAAKLQGLLEKGWCLALHGDDAGEWRTLVLAAWMVVEGGMAPATALERLARVDPSLSCPPELAERLAELTRTA